MDGILCIDKPQDITSFACCARVRRLSGQKKAGHGGTLDPMATGVLPILLGKATRALDLLPCHDKRYVATLQFGFVSDTLDIWGQVSPTGKAVPTLLEIQNVLHQFRGDILQVPPMTSALKKDGKRLYELAREGIVVEREARPITVYSLDIVNYDEKTGELTIDCHCSKGTYIRSICDDLGRVLECGAVMTALRRTMAAGFSLDDAVSLEQATELAQTGELNQRILPIEYIFREYPEVTVTGPQAIRFQNGGALAKDRLKVQLTDGIYRVKAPDGVFLGLGKPEADELKILKLFV